MLKINGNVLDEKEYKVEIELDEYNNLSGYSIKQNNNIISADWMRTNVLSTDNVYSEAYKDGINANSIESKDEYEELREVNNNIINNLEKAVKTINKASEDIKNIADELREYKDNLQYRTVFEDFKLWLVQYLSKNIDK